MTVAFTPASGPSARSKYHWLWNLIFVFLGLGGLAVGGWLATETRDFIKGSIQVPGRVVHNEIDWSGRHSAGYHTIFSFTDPATGKSYEIHDNAKYNPALFDAGTRIKVFFPPGQPEAARINCFRSLWLSPTIAGGGGAVILLVGLIGGIIDFVRRPK